MTVSPYLNNDVWQRAYFIVDFSIEQKVAKNWFFYAKLNNLLNTPMRADILLPNTFNPEQAPYLDASSSVLVREDFYGQTYFAGIKFKF
jgi:outer membrane receptor for ferrienterochelin and colicin